MKVLFVGEGRHDIGDFGDDPFQPRPAKGSIPTLAQLTCPTIDRESSLALAWTEIRRFHPDAKKRGLEHKVAAAVLLSVRRFGCDGTVCVTDQDRDEERLKRLSAGRELGRKLFQNHPLVCGVAIESIEAWTLGAPDAIAAELGVAAATIRKKYPHSRIEELYEESDKPEHRPKSLLERLAQLKNRHDSTDFREAVAARTEISDLEKSCPNGFKPFADALRITFQKATV